MVFCWIAFIKLTHKNINVEIILHIHRQITSKEYKHTAHIILIYDIEFSREVECNDGR